MIHEVIIDGIRYVPENDPYKFTEEENEYIKDTLLFTKNGIEIELANGERYVLNNGNFSSYSITLIKQRIQALMKEETE